MFHLLVSGNGWEDGGGTMGNGRIYIDAETSPGSKMLTNGKLDIAKVGRIPALLVSEPAGSGPEMTRVAYITRLSPGHSETSFEYALDTSVVGITNHELEKYSGQLKLGNFGLNHSHWKVCDVDLFKLLLTAQQRKAAARANAATG